MINQEQAKPGDTIKITKGLFVDQEFLVVECPDNHKNESYSHYAWVEYRGGICFFEYPEGYEIILRAGKNQPIKNDDVDTFLKKQMNANLRNLFT